MVKREESGEEVLEDGEEEEEDQAMTTPHHLIQELGNDLQETMVLLNKHGDLDFGLVRRQVLLAVILQETERIDKIKVAAGVAEVEVAGVEVLDLEAQAQALPLPILGQILDSALHREDSYPSNLD